MLHPRLLIALLGLSALAGCSQADRYVSSPDMLDGRIRMQLGTLHLRGQDAAEAEITRDGGLTIAGQPIGISGEQRALLVRYYQTVATIRSHGLATGEAAIGVASEAIKRSAEGAVGYGDEKTIESHVDAKADAVDHLALKVCEDMVEIEQTQDALSAQLAAFKPYARIVDQHAIEDCRNDVASDRH